MKKTLFFLVFCILITNSNTANAITKLTDDLPSEYINEVKSRSLIRDEPDFPDYEKKTATTVKVHSKEKLTFQTIVLPQQKLMSVNTIVQNAKINDQYTFVVAEDVYQNNKLIIKKGTNATGP